MLTESALLLLSIVEYLFLDDVQEMIRLLESEFTKKRGPRAYPRTLVIGVLMFSLYKGMNSLKLMTFYNCIKRIDKIMSEAYNYT